MNLRKRNMSHFFFSQLLGGIFHFEENLKEEGQHNTNTNTNKAPHTKKEIFEMFDLIVAEE